MQLPLEVTDLASRQHALLSSDQAYLIGVSAEQLYRWRRDGFLEPIGTNVLRIPGSASTREQDAMAAVLDAGPGAVLSHTSAFGGWRVPGYRFDPFHVLQPRAGIRRRDPIATIHSSRRIPPHHIKVLDGIPITSPTRTLFDAGPMLNVHRLAIATDNLWARNLTTGPMLHDMLDELTVRGRDLQNIRVVLADRPRSYVPPASNLEKRFHHLLEADGQPPMDRQIDLGNFERWLGRVDAYDRDALLVVEIDSDRFHSALVDRLADKRRHDALDAAGYTILHIEEHDVWYRGKDVARRVWVARQDGRRRNGARVLVRRPA